MVTLVAQKEAAKLLRWYISRLVQTGRTRMEQSPKWNSRVSAGPCEPEGGQQRVNTHLGG